MQNMPHCRFANTLQALQECYDVIRSPDGVARLSPAERRAAEALLHLCGELHEWELPGRMPEHTRCAGCGAVMADPNDVRCWQCEALGRR